MIPPVEEYDLFDMDVTEISSVVAGDNRGAKILMFKAAPGEEAPEETPPAVEVLSDDAVDRIIAEVIVEEMRAERTATTTYGDGSTRTETTSELRQMTTRSDVSAVAKRRAAEIRKNDPKLTEAQALSKAWEDHALAELYEGAPADEAPARPPVRKGGSTVAKVEARAAEIRKADPRLTRAQAMAKAWSDDELGDEYELALRG